MINVGIDVGGKNLHIVLVENGKIIYKGLTHIAVHKTEVIEEFYEQLLQKAGRQRSDVNTVISTGSKGKIVSFANYYINIGTADALGAINLFPTARTVIDIGAEESLAIKINPNGQVLDFAFNENCAAGTGTFIEAMAVTLDLSVEEMAIISLQSTKVIPINAQCAVFGESEVISLLHQKTAKPDIARAVLDSITSRIFSLVKIIGVEKDVLIVGGVANNIGFINSLKMAINVNITVPPDPEYVGAYGAALTGEASIHGEKFEGIVLETKNIPKINTLNKACNFEKVATGEAKEYWKWPTAKWVNPDIVWGKGKIITAGVDVGSVSTKVAILVDGELYAFGSMRTEANSSHSASACMNLVMQGSNMNVNNIDYCIGTGYGKVNISMAQQTITEISCHARGATFFYGPSVRTVLDMGGQDCKAISVDHTGKVLKFLMNDKCAAGTGRGIEVIADILRVPVWQIGSRSLQVDKQPPSIVSTCVVFTKSEVISLRERGWPENDILAAFCAATAHRIVQMLRRLGLKMELCITGGIAKNEGIVTRIEEELKIKIMEQKWYNPKFAEKGYPFDTQIIGAVGAALFAYELLVNGKTQNIRKLNLIDPISINKAS